MFFMWKIHQDGRIVESTRHETREDAINAGIASLKREYQVSDEEVEAFRKWGTFDGSDYTFMVMEEDDRDAHLVLVTNRGKPPRILDIESLESAVARMLADLHTEDPLSTEKNRGYFADGKTFNLLKR